jgi:transposase
MVFIKRCKIKGNYYLYVVSNYREKGKIKQKFHGYLGREDNLSNVLLEFLKFKELSKCELENLSYSAPLELLKIANEIEIPKIITNKFPKEWGVDAGTASTLMILNYCFDSKSKNKLSDWYDQTYLKHELKISSKKINRDLLYHTLDFFDEEKIEDLHKQIFQKAKEKYNLSNEITMYDVTALFFEGDKCELAKRGYNSEARYKLQVNLGLAVTNEKFPVIHKVFEGNKKDVQTFEKIFNLLNKTINISNTIFIFDRGIKSKGNVEQIIKENSQYIAGATKNNTIKDIILSIKEKDFHPLDENNFYYEALNNPRTIIFWNKEIAIIEKRERDKKLNRILKELSEINPKNYKKKKIRFIEKVGEIVGKSRKFFDIEYKNFSFKLKEDEIKKAEYLNGKCAIETNTNFLAGEILQRYRNRNIVEMSFKDLKLFVDIRPIRHYKENRVLAHVFLAILAFGLRSLLELKLRRNNLQITAQEAIEQLSKIRVLCANKKILRTTGETETTKKIQQILSK